MNKKILILYISEYSGHFHAAKALEKALSAANGRLTIKMVNALEYTNPILGKLINKAYLEVIRKKPELWGNIYDNPDVIKKTRGAREALHRFNMSKIKKLIESFDPDIVFCTQAFPCGMVADYKRTSGKNIPLVGILTDHAPHSYWLFDEVDFYVVPSKKTAEILERKGIGKDKLKAYGIPVDPKFSERHDKEKIFNDLGLSKDKPIILIMGGSQGLGAIEEVVRSFLQDDKHDYQLIVVSGNNKKLKRKLSRISKKRTEYIKILPFVDNIDELMEISNIIITKAGGITTAEALAKKLPILVVDPIPGHERMNTDYLVDEGAAIEVENYGDVHDIVNILFDSEKLSTIRKNAEKLSMPASALNIAEFALGILK